MKKLNYQVYEGTPPEDNLDKNNLYIEGDVENGVIKSIKSIKMSNGNEVIDFPVSPSRILDFEDPLGNGIMPDVRYTKSGIAEILHITTDDIDKLEQGEYIFGRCVASGVVYYFGPISKNTGNSDEAFCLPTPLSQDFSYSFVKEGDEYYIPI